MAVTLINYPGIVNLQGIPCQFSATSNSGTARYITLVVQELVDSVWTDAYIPDTAPIVDGAAQFDVSGFFAGELKSQFSFPEHSTNMVLQRPQMIRAFRVKLYEPGAETSALEYGTTFYMMAGGISNDDYANLNEISSNWWEWHVDNKRALNWLPANKSCSPQSIEKIYWIQDVTRTDTLRINWTGTNGSSGIITKAANLVAYMPVELSVSPALVEELSGTEVASYTVQLVTAGFEQRFTVDRQHYEWNEFFLFENDLSGFDGVWCHGARIEKLAYNQQQYQRSDLRNIRATDRIIGNIRGLVNREVESDSGFVNIETREWLGTLLNTTNAYRVEGLNIRPITITTKDLTVVDELKEAEEPLEVIFSWIYSRPGKFTSKFTINLERLFPPYYEKLAAFFYKQDGGRLIDMINGSEATISGANITWPGIAYNDVFDYGNSTFWKQELIADTSWYDSGNRHTCPLSWMVGTEWAEAGTNTVHARLFHRDYQQNAKDTLPILVYPSLSKEEQRVVCAWLGWYATLWEDGAILAQNEALLTQQ